MNPWEVTTDGPSLRRLGKTQEELAELQKVVARIIIQGIDESDPHSGESNRLSLQKEIADVYAQTSLLVAYYQLDEEELLKRVEMKMARMREWDEFFDD